MNLRCMIGVQQHLAMTQFNSYTTNVVDVVDELGVVQLQEIFAAPIIRVFRDLFLVK